MVASRCDGRHGHSVYSNCRSRRFYGDEGAGTFVHRPCLFDLELATAPQVAKRFFCMRFVLVKPSNLEMVEPAHWEILPKQHCES